MTWCGSGGGRGGLQGFCNSTQQPPARWEAHSAGHSPTPTAPLPQMVTLVGPQGSGLSKQKSTDPAQVPSCCGWNLERKVYSAIKASGVAPWGSPGRWAGASGTLRAGLSPPRLIHSACFSLHSMLGANQGGSQACKLLCSPLHTGPGTSRFSCL